MSPRVTLGVATYERDTYLQEAVASCLRQTYDDLEVLVVLDGGRNPGVERVLAGFDDPRLRLVRHERNRGIAEAYNTIIREGRGELVAMLGDDDVSEPDRIARQVAVFDRHPDTGVAHGAASIIDGQGVQRGTWPSQDRARHELLRHLVREHNTLVDPTRMVHRRVYEAVGGYSSAFRLAQDFDFWLRALRGFRFRDVPGGPLIGLRRHGDNFSDESAQALEVQEVQNALRSLIETAPLRELVPELDWGVMHPDAAERRALEVLADALERRVLPLPGLARELRSRAARVPAAPRPRPNGRKIVLTSFGFNDSGGGTTVPRVAAKELARRGWDVTVFHAATRPDPSGEPYAIREWDEDGVHLVGIHNRQHGLWDLGHPLARARRPADHAGLRRAAGPRGPRRRALPQPAQPRVPPSSTRPPRAACRATSRPTTTGSSARAPTCSPAPARSAEAPATAAATAPRASARRTTPPATSSAWRASATASRAASRCASPSPTRCAAPSPARTTRPR